MDNRFGSCINSTEIDKQPVECNNTSWVSLLENASYNARTLNETVERFNRVLSFLKFIDNDIEHNLCEETEATPGDCFQNNLVGSLQRIENSVNKLNEMISFLER